ncbi:hypothetical protein [Leptothoe kymatousa]|uniref:Uncharacterized protein n=1 Tax=Leptothoe kymatousa TAU-MAC 1615 TaxID=2364775 RepID=A0ABS5Y0N0_9CYAN|nr:hypothetical protein [Leptothoe kymatousa]MBT9311394.1 hypothetical protein [Leptothoe kymatousa TAU-MAC 1615]
MKHRLRQKKCALCQQTGAMLYRVKYTPNATQWAFVCPTCWPTISQDNVHYRYGGTWKAKKRP